MAALGVRETAVKKFTITVSMLVVVLLASNAWWAYRLLDAGISYTYQGVSLEENQQALSQAFAIIKVLGTQNTSRTQIVEATQAAWPSTEPFEKEGFLWIGRLGLRFNNAGQLVEIVPGF